MSFASHKCLLTGSSWRTMKSLINCQARPTARSVGCYACRAPKFRLSIAKAGATVALARLHGIVRGPIVRSEQRSLPPDQQTFADLIDGGNHRPLPAAKFLVRKCEPTSRIRGCRHGGRFGVADVGSQAVARGRARAERVGRMRERHANLEGAA